METSDSRRRRSRSPRHSKSSKGGFKWKEKSSRRDDEGSDSKRLERGYRHDRDGYREREEYRRERDRAREQEDEESERRRARRDDRDLERPQADKERAEGDEIDDTNNINETSESISSRPAQNTAEVSEEPAPRAVDDDIARKFGASAASKFATTKKNAPPGAPASTPSNNIGVGKFVSSSKPNMPPPAAAPGTMIVVKVNDRLGNTTKVPCLPTDSVGDFKKLVAMRIGRKPHEIMLKRQSERPFKDFLQLVDYGVSDGVQLDLELDTGD